ncbi:glycosyltransferase [Allonocardiopsis opalescens]|uniref:Glycosyltransferase involved in cell wall biosynthesis n=1 Tax=Allonocardiopsis opalescens TaxID=1144618 RepID=A0A2T0Q018_9ACTN|nr:glycosyltransferase [Allonocardiopsis opalescens]PRX97128.1 glycosyltransferase involved in cell wall biosynthesis [Allonocardiopsis opalescens]
MSPSETTAARAGWSAAAPARRSPAGSGHRIGYVLKMFPRFSETFVVSEILARQARGTEIEVFSLRLPNDGRFHAELAEVTAPVSYLPHRRARPEDCWRLLRAAHGALPRLTGTLPDLLAAEPDDGLQAVELALAVRERGITHLHAHFGSVATTVARLASLLTGVPYSFTAHAKDLFHESVDPKDLRAKLAGAQHTVAVSDYNRAHLERSFGAAASRVHRVYNGLRLADFDYTEPTGRPPLIAGVGRLVEKKGFEVLVDACALLAAEGVEFDCVIAGAGPLEAALRERIDARGLGGAVRLAGPLPADRVRALMRGAAALAAPCVVGSDGNADGLPTVLLEAMALGTPCVSTDVTGIPEAVRHGETGLSVPQHDPAALAAALRTLLADRAAAVRLARAARAHVERNFDGAAQARALDALLPPVPAAAPPAPALAAVPAG